MNRITLIIAILLAFSPLAWSSSDYDAKFEEIMPYCEQHFLPNSMAQLPSTNRKSRAKEIQKHILMQSREFDYPAGISYLQTRLGNEQDSVAQACIRLILKYLNSAQ